MRGRPRLANQSASRARSIPAYAGETPGDLVVDLDLMVDPRVCGGDGLRSDQLAIHSGRSPRMRGRPYASTLSLSCQGSIPAYAGETHHNTPGWLNVQVDPRVCGGDEGRLRASVPDAGRSPRMRGRQEKDAGRLAQRRSIPAYAGETAETRYLAPSPEVDPRVCGGDSKHIFA